jgi:hypothetical protein
MEWRQEDAVAKLDLGHGRASGFCGTRRSLALPDAALCAGMPVHLKAM